MSYEERGMDQWMKRSSLANPTQISVRWACDQGMFALFAGFISGTPFRTPQHPLPYQPYAKPCMYCRSTEYIPYPSHTNSLLLHLIAMDPTATSYLPEASSPTPLVKPPSCVPRVAILSPMTSFLPHTDDEFDSFSRLVSGRTRDSGAVALAG